MLCLACAAKKDTADRHKGRKQWMYALDDSNRLQILDTRPEASILAEGVNIFCLQKYSPICSVMALKGKRQA